MKFYICKHCKNIITKLNDSNVDVICCGEKMQLMLPGETDGALEKHVPLVKQNKNEVVVEVGSIEHPMVDAHYIMWIVIETTKGHHVFKLKPNEKPCCKMLLAEGEELITAYEYCNLHGLWKS